MRYYFDIVNGQGPVADETGQEFEDDSTIEREVSRILTDIACEEVHTCEAGGVSISVRNEAGLAIYQGQLTFQKHWLKR